MGPASTVDGETARDGWAMGYPPPLATCERVWNLWMSAGAVGPWPGKGQGSS
jgi:hypothetical protein